MIKYKPSLVAFGSVIHDSNDVLSPCSWTSSGYLLLDYHRTNSNFILGIDFNYKC